MRDVMILLHEARIIGSVGLTLGINLDNDEVLVSMRLLDEFLGGCCVQATDSCNDSCILADKELGEKLSSNATGHSGDKNRLLN